MIACDRPLVYRWLTNRLTWASLGGGGAGGKVAVQPSARAGESGDKNMVIKR